MKHVLRAAAIFSIGLAPLALCACQSTDDSGKQVGSHDTPQANEPRPGTSMNDAVPNTPSGGMTVQPPQQPVGPTPAAGSDGSAGTGTGPNGGGTGR